MLNANEFASWCKGLGLPRGTVEIIETIRSSSLLGRLRGGNQNGRGLFLSRKMGQTIQFESNVELALLEFLEHDQNVLEYYCQPVSIELRYLAPTGKTAVASHTPDYFVLWQDRAGWVDAKDANMLPKLAERAPNRYQLVGGNWECPPGRAYAEPLNLCYVLHASGAMNRELGNL
jgi:putative transposase